MVLAAAPSYQNFRHDAQLSHKSHSPRMRNQREMEKITPSCIKGLLRNQTYKDLQMALIRGCKEVPNPRKGVVCTYLGDTSPTHLLNR